MNIRNVSTPLLYAVSALAVLALAAVLKPGDAFVSIYWPVAFWALAGYDFWRSQVVENGESELDRSRFSFADRFIGYIFAAPFILPARVYQLAVARSGRS